MQGRFRFSFGPWNLSQGADPFGPVVRESIPFNRKLAMYRGLGFGAVQFHDDDAVPGLEALTGEQILKQAKACRRALDRHGLKAEFVAPRLWESPWTVDGAYTSNDPKARRRARDRSRTAIDIAGELGTKLIVLWLAREGTYIREAKDPVRSADLLVGALDDMLAHDPAIRLAIEPKPNEPMDQAYLPTTGHALAIGYRTMAPERVGINVESAHAILAGLDPAEEMGFALSFGKLWTVHLNDQNGLKFDEDKTFGSVDLRRALNQVRVLDRHGYGQHGEWVGLDVKAMRTQKARVADKHLSNSREIFLRLLDVARGLDQAKMDAWIASRDYEELERYVLRQIV